MKRIVLTGAAMAALFTAGSLGTFKLTAGSASGPPTATSFGKAKYVGTVTLTGASGMMKGITGNGAMACYTPDSLHYTCMEKLILSPQVTTTTTVPVRSSAPSRRAEPLSRSPGASPRGARRVSTGARQALLATRASRGRRGTQRTGAAGSWCAASTGTSRARA